MNSKEVKINIEVKIGNERIAFPVEFYQQENVRMIESEIRFKIKELREKFPGKGELEILAMATYNYASAYFYLAKRRKEEMEEAELLLNDAERLRDAGNTVQTDGYDAEVEEY